MEYKIEISSLEQLNLLAKKIADNIIPNFLIGLSGDLGSGKTTFVQFILRNLGISGKIKSPSYSVLEQYYLNNYKIFHFDLYRLNNPHEWLSSGFDEILLDKNITLIEWIEKADSFINQIDIIITITNQSNIRQFSFLPLTKNGLNLINLISNS